MSLPDTIPVEFYKNEYRDFILKNKTLTNLPSYHERKSGWPLFWIKSQTGDIDDVLPWKMTIISCYDKKYWYKNMIGEEVSIIHNSSFCAIVKRKNGSYGYVCHYDLGINQDTKSIPIKNNKLICLLKFITFLRMFCSSWYKKISKFLFNLVSK